ncbi:hypothetical protein C8F04DRAFT_950910, partial [Mycena alexandri]
ASFAPDVFTAFAPAAYHLARELTTSLLKDDPTLTPPFPGVFTTATFGVGPRIVGDVQHPGAAPWCWIALTALGSFDPERGGHIIFWDLGRVLQFPPGATILMPSLLRYTIADIQEGETRYSLTRYLAASEVWQRWPAAPILFSKLH